MRQRCKDGTRACSYKSDRRTRLTGRPHWKCPDVESVGVHLPEEAGVVDTVQTFEAFVDINREGVDRVELGRLHSNFGRSEGIEA